MPKPLVIVESPAKAKTIAGFLGSGYAVESSIGHIRDLPRKAQEVPAAYKDEPWAKRWGVDVDNDFKPLYIVPPEKKAQVTKLKALLKDADEVYLATDEDREGEAIAWHLLEVLSPRVPVRRMVFHEITRAAIERAVSESRDLDRKLVDAQETRRILDRLVGWDISEVLWKKVSPRLSAGRVQSVATRLVVERERARMAFRSAGYWDLEGTFSAKGVTFGATLSSLDGKRLASGKDFEPTTGQLSATAAGTVALLDEAAARGLVERLTGATFTVTSVESRDWKQSPHPPFITSTLQQEAGRKLRFGSDRTMRIAQKLYEAGYITYMRTDSVSLSEQAVAAARAEVTERYGADHLPERPRVYTRKSKNAQEAHEAIRPAGDRFRRPEDVAREVDTDAARLYDLIWKRCVASQMADARGRRVSLRLGATSSAGEEVLFSASGKTITFPGFLRAYVEGSDDPDAELEDRESRLPALDQGEGVANESLEAAGHQTQPPARFTEASLVAELETRGIGRPSTYASVIQTIQDRGYVWKKGSALVPSWTAFAVVKLLEQHFAHLVDYEFTARMEETLDDIARGEREWVPWLRQFYFGNGSAGLRTLVEERVPEIDAREINTIPQAGEGCDIVVRVGRYGPYLSRGDQTAPVPDGIAPDELTPEMANELLERGPEEGRVLGSDPATGLEVSVRDGRYGPYVQLGEQEEGSKKKPKRASLFKTMTPDTVTLDDALMLLSLPRVVGQDDEGRDVVASPGRFGPYIKRGDDTRSLKEESQLLTITLPEALELLAQPKRGRGRQAAEPLAELGAHPDNGATVKLLAGRYGPYVTDGTTNASLPKDADPAATTLEQAVELLRARAAAGPAKRPARRAAGGAKKATRTTKSTGATKATKAAKSTKKKS
ncbi:MAG TPA: type I DNA topoisomerase [Acidimicrobiia bacterium]|nr:type I DNA topoisomerase [Acidimicrobiia bacterium]